MAHPQAIEVLVRRVARQVGVRRAEHWGLRGAFWGALLAAAVLAFKAVLGLAALVLAPALVLLGALAGAAYGLARRVAPRAAANRPARDPARGPLAARAAPRGLGPGAGPGDPPPDRDDPRLHAVRRAGAARGPGQHRNDGGAVAAAAEGPPQAAIIRGARLRAAHRYGQRVDRG